MFHSSHFFRSYVCSICLHLHILFKYSSVTIRRTIKSRSLLHAWSLTHFLFYLTIDDPSQWLFGWGPVSHPAQAIAACSNSSLKSSSLWCLCGNKQDEDWDVKVYAWFTLASFNVMSIKEGASFFNSSLESRPVTACQKRAQGLSNQNPRWKVFITVHFTCAIVRRTSNVQCPRNTSYPSVTPIFFFTDGKWVCLCCNTTGSGTSPLTHTCTLASMLCCTTSQPKKASFVILEAAWKTEATVCQSLCKLR